MSSRHPFNVLSFLNGAPLITRIGFPVKITTVYIPDDPEENCIIQGSVFGMSYAWNFKGHATRSEVMIPKVIGQHFNDLFMLHKVGSLSEYYAKTEQGIFSTYNICRMISAWKRYEALAAHKRAEVDLISMRFFPMPWINMTDAPVHSKPFNFEKAQKAGAQVVTRDGRKVYSVVLFKKTNKIGAVIEGEETPRIFRADGTFPYGPDDKHVACKNDLFILKEEPAVVSEGFQTMIVGGRDWGKTDTLAEWLTKTQNELLARINRTDPPPNTSPFNYEAALFGAPVVTRDGREIKTIHPDSKAYHAKYKRPCAVTESGYSFYFQKDTGMHYANGVDSPQDLFMVEKPKLYPFRMADVWKKHPSELGVVTRDGRKVDFTTMRYTPDTRYPLEVEIPVTHQCVSYMSYTDKGFFLDTGKLSVLDLFMTTPPEPKKKVFEPSAALAAIKEGLPLLTIGGNKVIIAGYSISDDPALPAEYSGYINGVYKRWDSAGVNIPPFYLPVDEKLNLWTSEK